MIVAIIWKLGLKHAFMQIFLKSFHIYGSSAFHSTQNSGTSNGMDHFDFVRREYSGPALKVVQFDRSGHFGRSNRNIPFHLTNLLFLVSLFWTLLSKTTSSFQWKVRCWIAWISHNFFWFFYFFHQLCPKKYKRPWEWIVASDKRSRPPIFGQRHSFSPAGISPRRRNPEEAL